MNRCDEGGDNIIFVTYKLSGGNQVVVRGRPVPGSKAFFSEHLGRHTDLRLKTLKLHDVHDVPLELFPFAYLLAPQQSTFVHWQQCEQVANRLIEGSTLDIRDPNTFLPTAIEVLCEEYLRREGVLERNLIKIGGSLKDFDIIGLDADGSRVLAQVKARSSVGERRKFAASCQRLDNNNGRWYFFADGLDEAPDDAGVTTVSIRRVVESFLGNDRDRAYLTRLATLRV